MMDINIVKRIDVSMTSDDLEVIKFALNDYLDKDNSERVLLNRYRDLAESMLKDINSENLC